MKKKNLQDGELVIFHHPNHSEGKPLKVRYDASSEKEKNDLNFSVFDAIKSAHEMICVESEFSNHEWRYMKRNSQAR